MLPGARENGGKHGVANGNRQVARGGAVAAALALLVCACAEQSERPLAVGADLRLGHAALFSARERGFDERGKIRVLELVSAEQVAAALRLGTLDVAALTLDEALQLREAGMSAAIVWVLDASARGDVLVAREEIGEPKDLRGRRIGVDSNGISARLLAAALRQGGLSVSDVSLVPSAPERGLELWESGEVDALVTFAPFHRQLAAHGARLLTDAARLRLPVHEVLLARSQALSCCAREIAALVDAMLRAQADLAWNPAPAARSLAPRYGLAPEQVEDALRALEPLDSTANRRLLGDAQGLLPSARLVAGDLESAGLIAGPIVVDGLLDGRFASGGEAVLR